MRSRYLTFSVAALAGLGLCVACSSSHSGGQSGNTSGATHVKIGVVAPGAGAPGMQTPDANSAAQVAVFALNKRGGLEGHPVDVVYCDDQGDPNQTATCGRQMVSDKVIAVVGGQLLNGNVLTPILAKAGIAQVGLSPVQGVEFTSPDVYPLGCGGLCSAQVLTAWAIKKRAVTALVSADNQAAVPLRKGLQQVAEQAGGHFQNTVLVPATQADFAPIVAAAERGGVKDVVLELGSQQTAQFISAANSAGGSLAYLVTKTYKGAAAVASLGGAGALDSVVSATPFPPLNSSNAEMVRFRTELADAATGGISGASVDNMQVTGFPTWLAVQALEKLVARDKPAQVTAQAITNSLTATKAPIDFGGVIPPWNPNTPGPKGIDRVSNTSAFLSGYKNGDAYLLESAPVTVDQIVKGGS
jgi:ABC-type branched-subunit amino acid transport system substrate-binding protein